MAFAPTSTPAAQCRPGNRQRLPLTSGNKVTLLVDGKAAYAAMFRAMEEASDTIDIEMYKIDDDEVGRRFAALLLKKQGEGVQVNLLYDSIGSLATPASLFEGLRRAGIQVVAVTHLRPPTQSDHRKLLIVGGEVVVTGGINISRVYASTRRILQALSDAARRGLDVKHG